MPPIISENRLTLIRCWIICILEDEDILDHLCSGECDRVHETQEHFEDLLKEIQEYADQIYQKILEGYTPGNRRTKKEQFALDQAIQIHNLIQKNT